MDGTGLLLANFLKALGDVVHPVVMSYPPDKPLTYHQLEKLGMRIETTLRMPDDDEELRLFATTS